MAHEDHTLGTHLAELEAQAALAIEVEESARWAVQNWRRCEGAFWSLPEWEDWLRRYDAIFLTTEPKHD